MTSANVTGPTVWVEDVMMANHMYVHCVAGEWVALKHQTPPCIQCISMYLCEYIGVMSLLHREEIARTCL